MLNRICVARTVMTARKTDASTRKMTRKICMRTDLLRDIKKAGAHDETNHIDKAVQILRLSALTTKMNGAGPSVTTVKFRSIHVLDTCLHIVAAAVGRVPAVIELNGPCEAPQAAQRGDFILCAQAGRFLARVQSQVGARPVRASGTRRDRDVPGC